MFGLIKKKLLAKLILTFILFSFLTGLILFAYFSFINKKQIEESHVAEINKLITHSQKNYSHMLFNFDSYGIDNMTQAMLLNREVVAVNVFSELVFLLGLQKKSLEGMELGYIKTESPFVQQKNVMPYKKISRDIIYNNNKIGFVEVFYTDYFVNQEIKKTGIKLFIIFVFFSVAFFSTLYFVLKKSFIKPVIELTNAAKIVGENQDFSLKVKKTSDDEVGVLADSFNKMIEKLNKSREELVESHNMLEEKVALRTCELAKINIELSNKIEERNRIEKELLRAKEFAEQANSAKSEFLANMSHEIRTPMNAILGFSELMYSRVTDEKSRQFLDSINAAGKTLLTLINDLLDLSKIEAGKLELNLSKTNIGIIFKEIEQIFLHKIKEKGLSLEISISPAFPVAILLDEVRFRQVLFNLVGNAVKFTEAGFIRISAEIFGCCKKSEQINLIISVADSGIGIPDAEQESIFEAFYQRHGQSLQKYGGTGLGLSISRRLINMMGGKISVESTLNAGSTFQIFLPNVLITDYTAPEKHEMEFDYITFEPALILIVDDIELNRTLMKQYLEIPEISTIEATNGKEAVNMAVSLKPNLILMDLKMPKMNGYEAISIIKANSLTANIPIIATSASVIMEDIELCMKKGAVNFLRKPISRSQLVSEIKKHLYYKNNIEENKPLIIKTEKTISKEEKARFYLMIDEIITVFTPQWEMLRKTKIIAEIAVFARKLLEIGDFYHEKYVKEWAEQLLADTESFDILSLEVNLQKYPELIEKIKKNYNME